MKIFTVFMTMCLITELWAYYAALQWRNNMAIYGIGSVLQTALIAIYFNQTVDVFKKYHIGIAVAALSVGFGIYDLVWLEPLGSDNSIYTLFQAFTTIVMSIMALRQNLLGSVRQPQHSRIAKVLLLFWTFLFLIVGLYEDLTILLGPQKAYVDFALFLFNVIANGCIAIIFSKYLNPLWHDS